jgi:hypothetical protein
MSISFSDQVWLFQQNGREDNILKRADTRKVRSVGDDTLIVTIDVGMEMNRGYCTTADGRNTKPFKFDNTREGFTEWLI